MSVVSICTIVFFINSGRSERRRKGGWGSEELIYGEGVGTCAGKRLFRVGEGSNRCLQCI